MPFFDEHRRLGAVHLGHRHIHDHHVRPKLFHHRRRFSSILRLADHLHVWLRIQNRFEPLANDHMVVHQHNAQLAAHEKLPLNRP